LFLFSGYLRLSTEANISFLFSVYGKSAFADARKPSSGEVYTENIFVFVICLLWFTKVYNDLRIEQYAQTAYTSSQDQRDSAARR